MYIKDSYFKFIYFPSRIFHIRFVLFFVHKSIIYKLPHAYIKYFDNYNWGA